MSRRRRRFRRPYPGWAFVIALIAAVAVVAGLPYAIAGDDARRPAFDPQPTRLALPAGVALADLAAGRVEEVIDGDTIDVIVDGRRLRVRYFGVDTPERGQRCYREATDRNESLIGGRVLLLTDTRDTDANGRSLRYVFLPSGVSADATLVAEGFAHAWRADGRYRDEIVALEAEARREGRGCLWREAD